MAAITSFHTEKCCHLVSQHKASSRRLCSSVDFPDLYYIRNCFAECHLNKKKENNKISSDMGSIPDQKKLW